MGAIVFLNPVSRDQRRLGSNRGVSPCALRRAPADPRTVARACAPARSRRSRAPTLAAKALTGSRRRSPSPRRRERRRARRRPIRSGLTQDPRRGGRAPAATSAGPRAPAALPGGRRSYRARAWPRTREPRGRALPAARTAARSLTPAPAPPARSPPRSLLQFMLATSIQLPYPKHPHGSARFPDSPPAYGARLS